MAADDNPAIIGTAVKAWGDAFRAISAMPVPAGAVLVLTLLIAGLSLLWMPDPIAKPDGIGLGLALLGLATTIIQSFLLAPLAIAVHRYVLLGEVTNRYAIEPSNPRYRRFVGFAILVNLIWSLPGLLNSFLLNGKEAPAMAVIGGLLLVVFLIIVNIVTVRRLILFPAIAVDAPGAGWRNARSDTKGHSWRVALTFVCVSLPFIVAVAPLAFMQSPGFGMPGRIAVTFISPFLEVLGLCAYAATASHFFRAYAASLVGPDGPAEARAAVA